MRGSMNKLLLAIALLAMLVGAASCADGDLDDDDAGDVVMSISALTAPPVTAETQSTDGTCSLSGSPCQSSAECSQNEVCDRGQACTLEVTNWSATILAQPKNSIALPPFNDIVLQDVTITYQWVNPGIITPPFVAGLGNVTVPTGGTNTVQFPPISSDAINNNPAIEGSTAQLTLVFRARTVEGAEILQVATRSLVVEVCQ